MQEDICCNISILIFAIGVFKVERAESTLNCVYG